MFQNLKAIATGVKAIVAEAHAEGMRRMEAAQAAREAAQSAPEACCNGTAAH